MFKQAIAFSLLAIWAAPAFADLADDIRICAKLTDAAARLKCYDTNASDLGAEPTNSTTLPSAPPPDLAKATVVKRLSPADLAVETHKWEGLVVETSLNCFYADKDEYRCFDVRGYAKVRVDFTHLNAAGSDFLQKRCDTITLAQSPACFVKIRFTYDEFDRQDLGGIGGNLTFVKTKDFYGEVIK